MSRKEKLIVRLKSNPKDFTFEEAQALLELLGYRINTAGKTSGSRVKFVRNGNPIFLHKPHPRKELLDYQLNQLIERLTEEGLI